jgi:ABC-type nitrate/sulfonate/bicarbonate transport system permease component
MLLRQASGWLVTSGFFGVLILSWHFVCLSGFVAPYLLPAPLAVWDAAITAITEGYPFGVPLWIHAANTFRLAVFGFAIGAGLAIVLALPIGWYPPLRRAAEPMVALFRGIPALAWIPIAILVFGISDASKIFIIVYGTFWIMLTHSLDGIGRVDPALVRVAQTFGASTRQILVTIVLPASLPAVFTGLRVGYALAFGVVLSAEMVGAFTGLGFLIQDARDLLRTDLVIVGMIAIGLLGYVTAKVLFSLERVLIRWRPPAREAVVYEG